MFDKVLPRPLFRPGINVGGMLDIPAGHYELGAHGESILNSGAESMTGWVSRPNNFKTAFAVQMSAMIRRSMLEADLVVYDSEGTFDPVDRYERACKGYEYIDQIDWQNDPHFHFTDISQMAGDEFFKAVMDTVKAKSDHKKWMRTTPFIDAQGKNKEALYPTILIVDSFSKLQVTTVLEQLGKNAMGHKKNTTGEMNTGRAKSELFNQLPLFCARNGIYMILTAHVKDKINMEEYGPDRRNLASMSSDTVIGGAAGMYSIPNNVWAITANKHFLKDKLPIYPLDNKTAMEMDTDLRKLTIENWRGKGGMTGMQMTLLTSQTLGYQPSLSEFNYCKEAGFGFGGNLQNYYAELLPEVSLGRTTIRKKIEQHPELRRALEIQSDMLQMIQFHRVDEEQVFTDPKTLYEDLKEIGYDWKVLLDTRPYWVFKEDEAKYRQPFLSTMDLLRMRKGLYIPYWMSKEDKARIKANLATFLLKKQP